MAFGHRIFSKKCENRSKVLFHWAAPERFLSVPGRPLADFGGPGGGQNPPKIVKNGFPEAFFDGPPFRPRFGTAFGGFL